MGLPDLNVTVAHAWGAEIDKNSFTFLAEVSELKNEVDIVDQKQNMLSGILFQARLPGRPKMAEFTLKRGLTSNMDWSDWMREVQEGKVADARRGGAIIFYDYLMAPLQRVTFTDAMPKSHSTSAQKAASTEITMESIVLVCNGFKFEK